MTRIIEKERHLKVKDENIYSPKIKRCNWMLRFFFPQY